MLKHSDVQLYMTTDMVVSGTSILMHMIRLIIVRSFSGIGSS